MVQVPMGRMTPGIRLASRVPSRRTGKRSSTTAAKSIRAFWALVSTTTKGAQYCRSAGATVIGITDSKLSPLGSSCDHVLVAKSDMVSLVDSLVAPLSIVNALIVAIAARKEKELSQTFANLERIWEEYDVYEKRVDG